MGLIQATIETLASVLGCRQDQAEDVVHSTASARAAMSRRGFFMAAGAVAAGIVMLDVATAEAAYTYNIRAVQGTGYLSFAEALKKAYDPGNIQALMYPDQPLLKLVRKSDTYSIEPISADDYLFLSGDRPQSQDFWRFQDDTRELVCSSRRK